MQIPICSKIESRFFPVYNLNSIELYNIAVNMFSIKNCGKIRKFWNIVKKIGKNQKNQSFVCFVQNQDAW